MSSKNVVICLCVFVIGLVIAGSAAIEYRERAQEIRDLERLTELMSDYREMVVAHEELMQSRHLDGTLSFEDVQQWDREQIALRCEIERLEERLGVQE